MPNVRSLLSQMRQIAGAQGKNSAEEHPYKLGKDLLNAGDFYGAVNLFRKSIDEFPGFPFAYHGLGVCLYDLGENQKAKAAFNSSLDLNPHYAETYAYLGKLEMREKNYPEAERLYRKSLSLKPDSVESLLGLAKLLLLSRDDSKEEIQSLLKQAYFLRPQDNEILSILLDNSAADIGLYRELEEYFKNINSPEKAKFFEGLRGRAEIFNKVAN